MGLADRSERIDARARIFGESGCLNAELAMTRRSSLPRASATRLVAGLAARVVPVLALVLAAPAAQARYLMSADGPGGVPTYELLGKAYTIEVPDCGHMVPHITEEFDS